MVIWLMHSVKKREILAESCFLGSALLAIVVTLLIFGFMAYLGFPLMREGRYLDLLFTLWDPDRGCYGISPMVVGTFYVSGLAVLISFPVSLGCSILISVLAPEKISMALRGMVKMMTGIPTVIYGFVGVFFLVPYMRLFFDTGSGFCILSASVMLALLISPTMILFFSDSFDQVPQSYIKASEALGATPVQKFRYVILPGSWRGVLTGTVLGIGRALGDTLIALMLAGNAVAVPGSVTESARTLTAHIALVIAADYESLEFKSIFACGMTLYLFTTLITLCVRLSSGKGGEGSNR